MSAGLFIPCDKYNQVLKEFFIFFAKTKAIFNVSESEESKSEESKEEDESDEESDDEEKDS